jgi:hypothetical protein
MAKKELTAKDLAVWNLGKALDCIEGVVMDVEGDSGDARVDSYHDLIRELKAVQEKLSGIQNRIEDGDFTDVFDPHPRAKKARAAKAGGR